MQQSSLPKKEAISFGWKITKQNIFFFIGIIVISIFLFLPIQIILAVIGDDSNTALLLNFPFTIISIFIGGILSLGFTKITLMFAANEKPEIGVLFSQYRLIFYFLFANIIVSIFTSFGFLFFIIPGIIISTRAQFFSYLIVGKNLGPIAAIKQSMFITKGHVRQLLLFSLMLIGINILGAIPLGLGLILTFPTSMLATAYIYRHLVSEPAPASQEPLQVSPPLPAPAQ